ncbi:PPC domain-containing protein [Actinoplanes xinjiangensis]|nr:PPC domain-containing protein [Actinoplanes xinjiangensis]
MRILRRLAAAFTGAMVVVTLSGAASSPLREYEDKRLILNAEPISANRATFEATDGDRLTVVLRRGTLPADSTPQVVIRTADGAEITRSAWWEPVSLARVDAPADDVYIAEVVDPAGGTGTLQLVGTTRKTTTMDGPPLTLSISKPGERVFVTFPAIAGKPFTVVARSDDASPEQDVRLAVHEPGGRELGTIYDPGLSSVAPELDIVAPATGTYALEMSASGDAVGTVTVYLTSPAEPESITVNGPDLPLTFDRPGRQLTATFPAIEGRRLFVVARGAGLLNTYAVQLTVEGSDGRTIGSGSEEQTDLTVLGFPVHRTGRHLVRLDADPLAKGKVDVAVLEAATATARVGGPAVELDIDRPGRPGFVTVPAAAGERLTALITTKALEPDERLTDVTVRSPHGTTIASGALGAGVRHDFTDTSFTTRSAGPHTVQIEPDGLSTGRFAVRVVGSSTVAAEVGGPAVLARTPEPGGRAFVRFDVTAGQWLDVVVHADQLPEVGAALDLLAPDGAGNVGLRSYVSAADPDGETITFTPPASGTYLLEVDPDHDHAGSVTVQIKEH